MNLEKRESDNSRHYLVTVISEEGTVAVESSIKPLLGGYISMRKYGNPDYCPSATRHHRKAKAETGQMKNLIYFDSVETAVLCGYSPCGNCWIRGDMAVTRWKEYIDACNKFGIVSIPEPKVISNTK
ncbi:MAG: hypothetical protein UW35_C0051G0004 [Candidatus Collierbacteria bacterium GW2011_GWF2_44_15]|uniref:Uncharacterized protein n=2 Tax=Candidatus Collieribacteriota TaxID=1752725 RepID=A0A0G1JJX5_9BACT|nr:MAG: hypothetical protein UW23_C0043G0003 [Candidatus Collierbacteria bacterium GW2011_GWA1_44_12]KKT44262.1 MAG: hypothetical protein UW35_C0051G0004 [Candidatus Collierbacteria bacterium GW2011_GWF2_44_15]